MSDIILKTENLKKSFEMAKGRKVEAVKGIDFDVKRGEIFGFLGPNGTCKLVQLLFKKNRNAFIFCNNNGFKHT